MLVSVVIPNWNGRHLIGACLDSLRSQTYSPMEIVVVDGGSRDGSPDFVSERYPEVRLIRLARNLGFAGNVNAGLNEATGVGLALLNNDAVAEPEWIGELVRGLEDFPGAGSCASKILHLGDRQTIASAGDFLGRDGIAGQRRNGEPDDGRFDTSQDVFSASGGAAIYRRTMLTDVGLFDEEFFMYLEDVDLGLRARLRGWGCRYMPRARVYHRVSATGGGSLASYYVGRNSIRLIIRGLPKGVLGTCWPTIVQGQLKRALTAARAYRGIAARATLRGQIGGLQDVAVALRSRSAIQARRILSDAEFLDLLTP